MLSHHLTDETLQDYAAGVLNMPMETLIACHLTVCPSCRSRSTTADVIGGSVLSAQDNTSLSVGPDDIIAMDSTKPALLQPLTDKESYSNRGVPLPLARLLPSDLHNLPWKSFGPGRKQYDLIKQPRKLGAFKLTSVDPGCKMSSHSHQHRELTFIISGSYSDEFGQFNAGDVSDLSNEHHHTPKVDSSVPCVSLVATDAPLKFDTLVGKIIQPFVGF